MEENIGKLIDSLTELVRELRDKSTGSAVEDQRKDDGFFDPNKEKNKEQQDLADKITKGIKDNDDESERSRNNKKQPRKILDKVTSVKIVDIDKKVLSKLSSIIPSSNMKSKIDDDKKKANPKGFKDILKTLGLGALALVIAPIVTLVTSFQTIAKQAWFLSLKKLVTESKFWGAIKSFAGTIKSFFGGLGAKFPVLGSIFGKVGGVLGKVLGTIKSVGGTIFNLIQKTKIYTVAEKIGKFIGNIFAPIIILWGAVKTVMGAIEGYNEDGIAGAIKGGINALFDFMVGDLAKLIAAIPAWILEKIGLKNMAGALTKGVDGIIQSLKDLVGGLVDTVVGVFTFDKERILKGIGGLMDGQVDLVGWVLGMAIDPAINFLKDVFKWGDPGVPFSFKEDVVDPAWKAVKDWFNKILSFGDTADGGWSLLKFVNNVEQKIKDFFIGMFTWAFTAGATKQGEWSLTTFIGTVFEDVKAWLVSMFSWVNLDPVWSLKDAVTKTWNNVKTWFTSLISWSETDMSAGVEDGFIISSVKGVVLTIKMWFDKLLTFDSAESTITSLINIKTWLPNLVTTGLGKISEWFLRLFGFDEQADTVKEWNDKFSIGSLVVGAVSAAWEWVSSKFHDASKLYAEKWDEVAKGFKDVGEFIWSGVSGAWNWLKELWDNPKKIIEDGWNRAASGVSSIGDWIWNNIKDTWSWFKGLWSSASETLERGWNQATAGVTDVGSWISSNITSAWSWFEGLWIDTKKSFEDGWNNLTGSVSDVGSWIWSKIKDVWSWFEGLWSSASESLKRGWNGLTQGVTNVGSWIWSNIKGVWSWFDGVWSDAKKTLKDGWNQATTGVTDVGSWIWSKMKVVWSWLEDIWTDPVKSLKDGWSGLTQGVTNVGSWIWSRVKTAMDYLITLLPVDMSASIRTGWASIFGTEGIGSFLSNRIAAIGDWFTETFGNLKKSLVTATPAWVKNPGEFIMSKLQPVFDFFHELFDFEKHIFKIKQYANSKLPDMLKMDLGPDKAQMVKSAVMKSEKSSGAETFGKDTMRYISANMKWHELTGDEYRQTRSVDMAKAAVQKKFGNDLTSIDVNELKKVASALTNDNSTSSRLLLKEVEKVFENKFEFDKKQNMKLAADSKILKESIAAYERGEKPPMLVDVQKVIDTKPIDQPPSRTIEQNKILLDSISRMNTNSTTPVVSSVNISPWEGKLDLGPTIQRGIEPQPVESNNRWNQLQASSAKIELNKGIQDRVLDNQRQQSPAVQKTDKTGAELNKKMDMMVKAMTESIETQKQTLEVLQQGKNEPAGSTVVNSGGNSTTVNNITTQSDIMTFRNQVLSRLHNK
jgi:phage-related protein